MAKLFRNVLVVGIFCGVMSAHAGIDFATITNALKKKFEKPVINGVGVVKITGKIEQESVEKIMKKVLAFTADGSVKGVLLVINSGGGGGAVSELLFREIKALSNVKPVVTIAAVCCSGAYLAASGSHWIVAPSMAPIGAIGNYITIERHKNVQLNNKFKAEVTYDLIVGGKFKALHHPHAKPLNEEERAAVQAEINAGYKAFCQVIAQQRKLPVERCFDWAEGRVFIGEAAQKKGLIDQVGGYSDAVKKLRELMKERGSLVDGKLNFIE